MTTARTDEEDIQALAKGGRTNVFGFVLRLAARAVPEASNSTAASTTLCASKRESLVSVAPVYAVTAVIVGLY